MSMFENIVITNIYSPTTVSLKKGEKVQIEQRPSWGLSFCISGQISYTHNGKTFISDPSRAILLPKSATYSLCADKEGLFPVINFECDKLSAETIVAIPLTDAKSYIKDYKALSSCFLFDNKKLRQYQLFYTILEKLNFEQSKTPLSSIIHFIENNLSDNSISNTSLAQKAGISEVYLRKLFISNLGVTPKQYILDLRLKKAKQLLTDTNHTVTTISEKCGFSNPYHFCRIFKEKTEFTPLEYSKKHKVFKI